MFECVCVCMGVGFCVRVDVLQSVGVRDCMCVLDSEILVEGARQRERWSQEENLCNCVCQCVVYSCCVYVRVKQRKRENDRERVKERQSESGWERDRERKCVKERQSVCVSERGRVCVRKRVWEREIERERDRGRE